MRFVLPVLAPVLGLSVVMAAGPGPTQTPETEAGFVSLFNGTDFTGWRLANPDAFRVEDGAIVANGSPGHAYYDGPVGNHAFTNFELRADIMAQPNSNGGIYILTEFQERGWPARGFEVQVNNTYDTDPVKTASLYHVMDINTPPARDNEWFTMAIVVQDMTITASVDGTEAVRWTQPPDWQGNPRPNGTIEFPGRRIGDPGTIALQAHDPGSTVRYRNIRIRLLD